eukprot:1303907-Alexandrium_andersonii.AAC.1
MQNVIRRSELGSVRPQKYPWKRPLELPSMPFALFCAVSSMATTKKCTGADRAWEEHCSVPKAKRFQ